jgi:REP element-mobilizing transposase RayT
VVSLGPGAIQYFERITIAIKAKKQVFIIKTKTITAKELYKKHPGLRERLWGGEFRDRGYCINTVEKRGNGESIAT